MDVSPSRSTVHCNAWMAQQAFTIHYPPPTCGGLLFLGSTCEGEGICVFDKWEKPSGFRVY